MLYVSLLVPIVAIIVLAVWFKHKMHILEYIGQFFVPVALIACCWYAVRLGITTDSQYATFYAVSAVHEEDWNEYVHRTCTRKVGKTTQTYDCSYVRYHPDHYYMVDNAGNKYTVDSGKYQHLVSNWGTGETVIGHHSGYTNSGDILEVSYPNIVNKMEVIVDDRYYTNKVAASHSVFNFSDVTEEEVVSNGLYEYPNISWDHYCPSVLGWNDTRCFDVLNARQAYYRNCRVIVLVYHNKPMSVFELQRNYWKNGNQNEFIIGVGVDSSSKVQWVNTMTWCERDDFNAEAKSVFVSQIGENLNLCEAAQEIEALVKTKWIPKDFHDFDYVKIDIPIFYDILVLLASILSSVGLGIYFVMNEYGDDDWHVSDLKFWEKRNRYYR